MQLVALEKVRLLFWEGLLFSAKNNAECSGGQNDQGSTPAMETAEVFQTQATFSDYTTLWKRKSDQLQQYGQHLPLCIL